MKRLRLWIVSELFYPEETSTGYFVTKIAEGLSDRVEVHAICSRPTYSERHLPVAWREVHKGVHIYRMRSTRMDKDALAGRLLNLVTFSLTAFMFSLVRFSRGDRVLVLTNPPTMPLLMGLAAKLRGARPFLLVHDVYPEILVATGLLRADGWAARSLGWITAMTYRLYERVVVLGRDMARVAENRLRQRGGRVVIIPNWGDVEDVRPLPPSENPFSCAHNPAGKTVVQISGNLGRTHDLESILAAAHRLEGSSQVLFQFIGYGGKTHLVRDLGRERPNICYVPRQPREMLGPMLAGADAVVISFVDRMLGVSVPSRMYNVMAAGTPIIAMADRASELAQVVAEEGCGWTIPPGDADALTGLVAYLATPDGKADGAARGRRGREAAVRRYSRSIVVEAFAQLLGA